jgi:hypothetical protein
MISRMPARTCREGGEGVMESASPDYAGFMPGVK